MIPEEEHCVNHKPHEMTQNENSRRNKMNRFVTSVHSKNIDMGYHKDEKCTATLADLPNVADASNLADSSTDEDPGELNPKMTSYPKKSPQGPKPLTKFLPVPLEIRKKSGERIDPAFN